MSLFLNIQPNTFTFNGDGLIQFSGAGANSKSPNVYVGLAALIFGGTGATRKLFSTADLVITSRASALGQITTARSQPVNITTNRPIDSDITS